MVRIISHPANAVDLRDFEFSNAWYAEDSWGNSSRFVLEYGNGSQEIFGGSGIRYTSGGIPYAGTMSSYVLMAGSDRMLSLTGVSIPVISVLEAANSWSSDDDQAIIARALRSADTFSGSQMADYFRTYAGNDVIDGNRGADTLLGDAGRDTLNGGLSNDWLYGGSEGDSLNGDQGSDRLMGGAGNDSLLGGQGADNLWGGDAADSLRGGSEADHLWGEAGSDILFGDTGNDLIDGGQDDDRLWGSQGADILYGRRGDDQLKGGDDSDRLLGEIGNDTLSGEAGADRLIGGNGADLLIGGTGDDQFIFLSLSDSPANGRDTIVGFNYAESDQINLSQIDANRATSTNDTFRFIGTTGFTHTAGELRSEHLGGSIVIHGDTNGDGSADLSVVLRGAHILQLSDFIL